MTLGEEIECRRLLIAFLFKQDTGIDILEIADRNRHQCKLDRHKTPAANIQHSCGVKPDHGISDDYHLHLDMIDNEHDPEKFYGSWEDL